MAGQLNSARPALTRALLGVMALWVPTGGLHAADARHEGVATCASTTCHGAARPLGGTSILQNEYVTWSTFDPHSSAFRTLQGDRSTAIARRLGIGSADQAPACLACHSEVVPAAQRGPKFQSDDGIGCEACHGAAENWLATHDDGAADTHASSLNRGLRALNDAAVRAEVCIACHTGGADRLATHAMMAAGHPRLTFELDTFTELWRTSGGREHFRRDPEYRARKPEAGATQTWLTGLVQASLASVEQVQAAMGGGALPEFAAFNCYACHRHMGLDRWRNRPAASLTTPGTLRINDSALRLLVTALEAWDPDRAKRLARGVDLLQRAANEDRAAVRPAADSLRRLMGELANRVQQSPPGPAVRQGMLLAVVDASGRGAYPDYATAEQAAMAAVVLLADAGSPAGQGRDLQMLFAALDDDEAFDQARFARILGRLSGQSSGSSAPARKP